MNNNNEVMEVASKLNKLLSSGSHYGYVFDKHLIVGTKIDISEFGLWEGEHNNLVGPQNSCVDLFYCLILMYMTQIKECMDLPIQDVVTHVIISLMKDTEMLKNCPNVMKIRTRYVSAPGNA